MRLPFAANAGPSGPVTLLALAPPDPAPGPLTNDPAWTSFATSFIAAVTGDGTIITLPANSAIVSSQHGLSGAGASFSVSFQLSARSAVGVGNSIFVTLSAPDYVDFWQLALNIDTPATGSWSVSIVGNTEQSATYYFTHALDTWVDVRVEYDGTITSLYIDDTLIVEVPGYQVNDASLLNLISIGASADWGSADRWQWRRLIITTP